VLVALLAVLFLTYGDSGPSQPASDALVRLDATSGKQLERVRTGTQLTGIATTSGAVWATDPGAGALIRLRSPAHEPTVLATRGLPSAVAAGRRFVVAANGDDGTVAVFETASGRLHATAHVTGSGAQAVCDVALEDSTGWAADCLNRRVVKFDADTGRVLDTIPLPPFADDETTIDRLFAGIAVGLDAVWVAGDALDPTLYRIGRTSGIVEAVIPVPAGTVAVAVGAGSVWLANQLDDSVIRIDPAIDAVADRIAVGREPLSIAFGAGSVWTANALDGTVTRIDPAGKAPPETLRVGLRPVAISAGPGGVWVATSRR
jgi:YVTN family beta-propeller protein